MRIRLTLFVVTIAVFPTSVGAEFKRGALYISSEGPGPCSSKSGPSGIVEFDPGTGLGRVFAVSTADPNFCAADGLRFTPDGSRLLMAIAEYNRVLAFDGDGHSEVYLNASSGIHGPYGQNGLAFNRTGDLFINASGYIRRFPAGGGPYTIFADGAQGLIFGPASLDFAPDGDLFYCNDELSTFAIRRFAPDGTGILFDDPPGSTRSLAVSRFGKLFVVGGSGTIYRYDIDDPASRIALTTAFTPFGNSPRVLTISPDGTVVYYADFANSLLYQIDAESGVTKLLVDLDDFAGWFAYATGMAVYAPPIEGDLDADGDTGLADYSFLVSCETGQVGHITEHECHFADLDHDGDVDLIDFGAFQAQYESGGEAPQ